MPKKKEKPAIVQRNIGMSPDVAERIEAIVTERRNAGDMGANFTQVARELIIRALNAPTP